MATKIYVLCEPDGEIRYIGKTSRSLLSRLTKHLYEARCGGGGHRCNWLRFLLSTGYIPTITLIGEVKGNGSKEEIAWIDYGRSQEWRLVNDTDGGGGSLGTKMSEEMRKKISLCHKGGRLTEEHKRKIGIAGLGRVCSDATKSKMSFNGKGRIVSLETRKKLSVSLKGHPSPKKGIPLTEATRRKISLAKMGGHSSLETRQKISLAGKLRWAKRKERKNECK